MTEDAQLDLPDDFICPPPPILAGPHSILVARPAVKLCTPAGQFRQLEIHPAGAEIVVFEVPNAYLAIRRPLPHERRFSRNPKGEVPVLFPSENGLIRDAGGEDRLAASTETCAADPCF
jgi:hypothetical protein